MGLLITGVLTTGQPSLPNFPENLPVQLDNDINQSEQSQLSEVVPANQITPPEFIPPDEQVAVVSLAIASDTLDDNYQIKGLADSEYSPVVAENAVADNVNYSNVQPEFTPISEATEKDDTFLVAFTSTTQGQDINKYTAVQLKSVHHQPHYRAGGLPQLPRVRTQQPRDYKRVAKFPSSPSPALPILGFGHTGDTVRVLQRLLRSNGYRIQVDGIFGALTESAVKAFQNRRNLVSDGIVGQRTWRELTK